jgi:carbon starvation protein
LTLLLIWLVPFLQIWVMFGAANQLMASLALLLVTLWLMGKGKNYQWTFWPFAFMFVTTIGALAYKAYEAFFLNLPKAVANAKTAKLTLGQYQSAQIIIGIIALILIVAAVFLAWDGVQAILRLRAKKVAPAKVSGVK